MAGKTEAYYWDTCLFIAWLKDEQRPSGEMDGVRESIERVKRREIKVFTSALTIVEISSSELPAGTTKILHDFMKRPYVGCVSVDIRIANLASDIREYYKQRAQEFNGKTVSVPDSIHLATAIINKASAFHTFDRTNRNGTLGLIPLSGNVGGHVLPITRPIATQPGLDLRRG